ncbi:MAG: hypothetical protein M0O93_04565 [Bacteroidales bacterium]|nr:hypothetical protein [Bacteroidales bacterium]
MKQINLIFKPIAILIVVCLSSLLFSSCERNEEYADSKLLMLKVDYLSNEFEGGTETVYSVPNHSFTITTQYNAPGDFGNIKLIYQEVNKTIFDGSIIWMGRGEISIPQNILPADQFQHVLTNDIVFPSAGYENVFNPNETEYDYSQIWASVQGLVKVREYLESNPNATIKLFLYTPSVGMGNPEDWDWIIFIKN